ncbi:D-alanyl-D-alanine carboxypeptidase/D-alanyl-D-alanine-endopeptidase [Fictibacillus sp. Mic-4]|uniref:D-alanyl-D-alanine carboxypeptidase/D-alanyl-D-alanine endopeptidase n=1 Tax=Fictibacillus sp. Mic-4 TaxID=3132826 RepID=UPI003CED6E67
MKRNVRLALFPVIMLSFVLQLLAVPSMAAGSDGHLLTDNIDQLLLKLENDENSKGIQAGVTIYNLSKNELLYSHNAEKSFVPASTLKLFVAATALDRLKPDYRFKTEAYLDGKLSQNGTLHGNLIIKGYGDPSLTTEDLDGMIEQLQKEKGLKRIKGNILVDESRFDNVRLGKGWMWDDEPWYYSAQISALSVNENVVDLEVSARGKAIGQRPEVSVSPESDNVKIVNEAHVVDGSKDDVTFNRQRTENIITISGTIGKDSDPASESITIEDPALFAGNVVKQLTEKHHIHLSAQTAVKKTVTKKQRPDAVHYSKPLCDLVTHLNKESDNFYAEMFLKTVGKEIENKGSFQAGVQVVGDLLKQAGLKGDYSQVDGSGLSRLNFVSPNNMLAFLRYVKKQSYWPFVEKSLPIAGVDGTLKNRMKKTEAENNLQAKTGSMSGVNNMVGFVKAKNGDQIAFAILMNGIYKSKYAIDFQDKVGVLLAKYPDLKAPETNFQPKSPAYPLSEKIGPIIHDPRLKGVTMGIIIQSLRQNNVLYAQNEDKLLTPGSAVKIWPTLAGLEYFGPDFRYETDLYVSKNAGRSGVLNGDVILKGSGDPSLTTEQIKRFALALKKVKIKKVKGDIVVDESAFDSERYPLGWTWDEEDNSAYPQISALSVNRGTVAINIQPGKHTGKPVVVSQEPKTEDVQIVNEAITVPSGGKETLSAYRERGKNIITVRGQLPLNAKKKRIAIAIEQPALYTGYVFKAKLKEAGIHVDPKSKVKIGSVPEHAEKIEAVRSKPLNELISTMNKTNDHFYAEMLTKTIGKGQEDNAAVAGTSDGVAKMYDLLKAKGINTTFDLYDGSGATRYNQVSANQLNATLGLMKNHPGFRSSLPEKATGSGIAETLSSLGCWTGYVTGKSGETYAVSILMNGWVENERVMEETEQKILKELARN